MCCRASRHKAFLLPPGQLQECFCSYGCDYHQEVFPQALQVGTEWEEPLFFRLFNPSDAFVIFFNSKSTRSLLGSLPRQAGFAEKSLDFYHETFHKCAKNFASCEPPLIVSTPNSLPIYSSHVSVPVSIHKGHKQHL
jgi:hypothetical protein